MTERAEGFWWVRTNRGSTVVEVAKNYALRLAVKYVGEEPWELLEEAYRIIEWGPYLGKGPETIESLERKISEAFAAAVPRFVVPPQRSEGEPVLLGEWRENPDPALDKELRRHERDD